jgi:hypothetical protein
MTTAQEDVIERVGGYIRHNAGKEPAAIRRLVQQGHEQLTGLLDGMTEQQATFKPRSEDWSVLELLHHVISAKRGVARTCSMLGRGEPVAGLGREGDEQDGMMGKRTYASLAEAREALEEAHQQIVVFMDTEMAQAQLELRFKHFLFGDLTSLEWAVFQRVHDGDHSNQIGQITSVTGFPGSLRNAEG